VGEQEKNGKLASRKDRDKLRTENNSVLGQQLVRNKYRAWGLILPCPELWEIIYLEIPSAQQYFT